MKVVECPNCGGWVPIEAETCQTCGHRMKTLRRSEGISKNPIPGQIGAVYYDDRISRMKFSRPKGFVGSTPRNWIDKNLPRCPFCKVVRPGWEGAMQFKLKATLYHFRCPHCRGILAIPVVAVQRWTDVAFLGPGGLLGKVTTTDKIRIESTGVSGSDLRLGAEYSVQELREITRNR